MMHRVQRTVWLWSDMGWRVRPQNWRSWQLTVRIRIHRWHVVLPTRRMQPYAWGNTRKVNGNVKRLRWWWLSLQPKECRWNAFKQRCSVESKIGMLRFRFSVDRDFSREEVDMRQIITSTAALNEGWGRSQSSRIVEAKRKFLYKSRYTEQNFKANES